jgi:hypothetical protein
MYHPKSGNISKHTTMKGGITIALSVYLSISIMALISFCTTSKKLHLYQILFLWMGIVFFDDLYFSMTSLNLEIVKPSYTVTNTVIRNLGLYVLTPIIVIWGFDFAARCKTKAHKGIWLLFTIGIMLGLEYSLAETKVLLYPDYWKAWWSLSEMVALLLLSYALLILSAFILRKDGIRI